jgi:hypothetical protein
VSFWPLGVADEFEVCVLLLVQACDFHSQPIAKVGRGVILVCLHSMDHGPDFVADVGRKADGCVVTEDCVFDLVDR